MNTHPDPSCRPITISDNGRAASREAGRARKELVFAVVLLSAAALFAAFLFLREGGGRRKIIKEGDRAPEFSLPALDRRPVSLADSRGKVVLVHFWATWCPPCVEEMPKLEALSRALSGGGFEILAVSVDEGGAPAVGAFMKKQGLSFTALLDPERAVSGRYGTFKFPETYVVDRNGTVRYKVIGPLDWTAPETMTAIRRLVEER